MRGIDLIKRMPLHLQKEFAREFVSRKDKKELIKYLDRNFTSIYHLPFGSFILGAFGWWSSEKGHDYWEGISENKNFNALPPKAKPTKTK